MGIETATNMVTLNQGVIKKDYIWDIRHLLNRFVPPILNRGFQAAGIELRIPLEAAPAVKSAREFYYYGAFKRCAEIDSRIQVSIPAPLHYDTSHLKVEYLNDCQSLTDLVNGAKISRTQIESIARTVGTSLALFYTHGLDMGDSNTNNVLIGPRGIHLVDFEYASGDLKGHDLKMPKGFEPYQGDFSSAILFSLAVTAHFMNDNDAYNTYANHFIESIRKTCPLQIPARSLKCIDWLLKMDSSFFSHPRFKENYRANRKHFLELH